MLSSHTPHAIVATSDLAAARAFYEGVLGFSGGVTTPNGVAYPVGSGSVMVYETTFAGTNKATALGFELDADTFDAEAAALRAAGVSFDTFESEMMTWQDGVAHIGSGKAAWFHDPDGNIIAISSGLFDRG